jgi:WD40 repeat protein
MVCQPQPRTVHVLAPCRWDLNIEGDDCLVHSLSGHAKRSFSVLWSPLLPHLLLSGSDDATARVWDTQSGSCVALLTGHRTEVRALCWHPELPWLVLTGMCGKDWALYMHGCGLKWFCLMTSNGAEHVRCLGRVQFIVDARTGAHVPVR